MSSVSKNYLIDVLKNNFFLFGLVFAFILILSLLSINQKKYVEDDIFGFWVGSNNEKEIFFNFKKDYTCTFKYVQKITKIESEFNGVFNINFKKKPNSLSIKNIDQLDYPLHSIIKFLDKDVIKIGGFSPKWKLRPTSFDQHSSILVKRN